MKVLIGVAATVAFILGGLGAAGAHAIASTCSEDSQCWNWRTMGNHKRTIVTIGGRHLVLGPARFDRANKGFYVDWSLTRRLRGDGHRFDVQDY